MKTITSRDNAQYKDLVKLAGSSQARRKSGRTLLDGVHLCQAYLQLRGLPADALLTALEACRAVGLGNAAASLVTISPFAGPAEHELRATEPCELRAARVRGAAPSEPPCAPARSRWDRR